MPQPNNATANQRNAQQQAQQPVQKINVAPVGSTPKFVEPNVQAGFVVEQSTGVDIQQGQQGQPSLMEKLMPPPSTTPTNPPPSPLQTASEEVDFYTPDIDGNELRQILLKEIDNVFRRHPGFSRDRLYQDLKFRFDIQLLVHSAPDYTIPQISFNTDPIQRSFEGVAVDRVRANYELVQQ